MAEDDYVMFFGQKPLIAEDVQDRLGDEERLSLNPVLSEILTIQPQRCYFSMLFSIRVWKGSFDPSAPS